LHSTFRVKSGSKFTFSATRNLTVEFGHDDVFLYLGAPSLFLV